MDFKQMMKRVCKDFTDKYGKAFIKEAKREQKISYLHKTTKIPSREWINRKRKEHKCTTGADYSGKLRRNWRYDKGRRQIRNKTKYASIIINRRFVKYIHKKVIKSGRH
jgi:hypothetical protein